MLLVIDDVLTPSQVRQAREELDAAEWVDGRVTAGSQSAMVKNNAQLPENHPLSRRWGEVILAALADNPRFLSAALPARIFPPLFNRYSGGQSFGVHVDNAVRPVPGTPVRIRTDLSATLFLSDPSTYQGGELIVETQFGGQGVKAAAGSLVLYPATSLHRVMPVTAGQRVASFFWIQSMVRDEGERALLFDLDEVIQDIATDGRIGDASIDDRVVRLTGIYHNLVRRWAQT